LSINSIKIFGERHSGTNAIGYFAGKNFNLKFQHDLLMNLFFNLKSFNKSYNIFYFHL